MNKKLLVLTMTLGSLTFCNGCITQNQANETNKVSRNQGERSPRYSKITRFFSKRDDSILCGRINQDVEWHQQETPVRRVMADGYKNYIRTFQSEILTEPDSPMSRQGDIVDDEELEEPRKSFSKVASTRRNYPRFDRDSNVYSVPLSQIDSRSEIELSQRPYYELGFVGDLAILFDKKNDRIIEIPSSSIGNTRFYQFVDNSEAFFVESLLRIAPVERLEVLKTRPRMKIEIWDRASKKIEWIKVVLVNRNCVVICKSSSLAPGSCYAIFAVPAQEVRKLRESTDANLPIYEVAEIDLLRSALRLKR